MKINAKPLDFLQVIDFDTKNIIQVYKGKLDNCRCGCGGDYFKPGEDDDEVDLALNFLVKYAEQGEVKFERFKYSDPSKNELYLEFETDIVNDYYDNGFDEDDDDYDDWSEEVRIGYGFYIKDIEK
jgi:hypothetical protein